VRPAAISNSLLQAARRAPERRILDEVAAMQLRSVEVDPTQVVAVAEQVMRGTLNLPTFSPVRMTLPFAPEELTQGLPTWQLMAATLPAADILLDAYRITRREEFLRQARDSIVAFAQYESSRWVDHGMMWNDHAIAARIAVLVKFWAEYRDHPEFEPKVGHIVLKLVARSAQLIAKPSFYAWRTGHGTLSDLALLQIATAFPELAESSTAKSVAVERFRNHLSYFINQEGVTLLHSAGYHSGSLYYFGIALRLFTLNGVEIPEEWWTKYAKAVEFYALLRRPDGTLPMFGDTASRSEGFGPPLTARNSTGAATPLTLRKVWSLVNSFATYPVAAHAIWWNHTAQPDVQKADQTVITWSYHPGLGHKLADELSVIFWAGGRTWVTNAGYWPYGVWGRDHAESWAASNAPHLLGESKQSERTSRVRGVGQGESIKFIDIERAGPQGYSVRRQIVHLSDVDTWIVLDHSQDSVAQTTTTNWTFYPDLVVTPEQGQGRFRIAARNSPVVLWSSFSGSNNVGTELVVGREAPFVGWFVLDRTPTRAPAVVVRQPSRDSWSLASFTLSSAAIQADRGIATRMAEWGDADHWTAVLGTAYGQITLTREGDRVFARRQGSSSVEAVVALAALDAPAADLKAVQEAVRAAGDKYHKFAELFFYRVKVSYFLLAVLFSQELLLFMLDYKMPHVARRLRVSAWVAWVTGGLWLTQMYFVVAR